ncbi:hypothetical protein [Pseudaestuariivita atlantica]|nr:hypothetical protein [Pseudaestuariivita atlantica]
MKRSLALLLLTLFLGACASEGPIFPIDVEFEDVRWVLEPDAEASFSQQTPTFTDTPREVITSFQLRPGQRNTALETGQRWRLGHTWLFGFDIRAKASELPRVPVDVARFVRISAPEELLARVQLDATNGITVMGRRCFTPSDLSQWVRVEMRVRIRDDDQGFLEVFCNRKPVWAMDKVRTTFAPPCRRADGCTTPLAEPARFRFQMGMMSARAQPRTAAIQMRRIHRRGLLYIPNRVGNLNSAQ